MLLHSEHVNARLRFGRPSKWIGIRRASERIMIHVFFLVFTKDYILNLGIILQRVYVRIL